jgi:hypothetical protein
MAFLVQLIRAGSCPVLKFTGQSAKGGQFRVLRIRFDASSAINTKGVVEILESRKTITAVCSIIVIILYTNFSIFVITTTTRCAPNNSTNSAII